MIDIVIVLTHPPILFTLLPGGAKQFVAVRAIMEEQRPDGYSSVFYVMLILGIIGIIGFLIVAAGAARGGF